MLRTTAMVPTREGLRLLVRQWPPQGTPWLHVLLVHGLGEHSGRYDAMALQMAAAGVDVHAYDHRGNGGSEGLRGDVVAWSQLHDDLEDRLADVRRQGAGLPVALYAHSMGGLIAAGYCLSGRPRPSMVVLSAPGFDSTLAGWKKALAPWLARVWPGMRLPNDVDPASLSRDPAVGAAVARDPRCGTTSTARFGAAGFAEQRRLRPLLSRGLGVPTLVLHGADDALVPVWASALLEGAPSVERRLFPGLRHELHQEPEGPTVVRGVIDWLRATAGQMR
jgi:alpha-beta hydrolase superfamily lysophospholipase